MKMRTLVTSVAVGFILGVAGKPVLAETDRIAIATGFGIGYLPLMIMEKDRLIEKHAEANGLGKLTVSWPIFAGGAQRNDAFLSENVQFVAGGIPSLALIWARTRENIGARGVSAMVSLPMFLNTSNARVKTIADFTSEDRIAVPSVKISVQAMTLQMASARLFGDKSYEKFDPLTVTMKHPDAQIALVSGKAQIDAHFASPPYNFDELKYPNIHTVLNSYDVIGGPHSFNVIWTNRRFHDENPKTYAAFVAALEDAIKILNSDKKAAAERYIAHTRDKRHSVDDILAMLNNPQIVFTTTPQGIMKYVDFMHMTGILEIKPKSWTDLFFPEAQSLPGN